MIACRRRRRSASRRRGSAGRCQDCALVTLHGRPLERSFRICTQARAFWRFGDGDDAGAAGGLLAERGMATSRLTVLRGDGRHRASAFAARRQRFDLGGIALNTIAVEVVAAQGARSCCRCASGLPTICSSTTGRSPSARSARHSLRRSRRAAASCCGTSAQAQARSRSSGCCADPSQPRRRASRRAPSAQRASAQRRGFGVPGLDVVDRHAPEALAGLPAPDAIFVGGGADRCRRVRGRHGRAEDRRTARRQCRDARDARPR